MADVSRGARRERRPGGYATVELVLVMPVLVGVLLVGATVVSLLRLQLACAQAAQVAARDVDAGATPGQAVAAAEAAAPAGAAVSVSALPGHLLAVRVTARGGVPSLLGHLLAPVSVQGAATGVQEAAP